MMSNLKWRGRGAGFGLALIFGGLMTVVACSKHETPARLDIASKPAEPSDDEWLHQQRLLHFKEVAADGTIVEHEGDVADAVAEVVDYCSDADALLGPPPSLCAPTTVYMCVARSLLALATAQSDPVTITRGSGSTSTQTVFDRVTEANSADFATRAAYYARLQLSTALQTLKSPTTSCRTAGGLWAATPPPAQSYALVWAASAVEAYHVALSAMDRAVEATLNASDAARSSSLSANTSMSRAIAGAALSRAAAAHLLVGGDDGILGSTQGGYCIGPELTPQARSALQLLRDAAPSPATLQTTTAATLSTFLNGTTTEGSIRQRLGAFNVIDALTTGTPVESYYGLDTNDFEQARNYMSQEIDVFARSQVSKAPLLNGFARYAGAGGDRVQALPPGAWAARARYYANPPVLYSGGWDLATTSTLPLDHLIAQTHAQIRELTKSTDHFSTSTVAIPSPASKEVLGVLSSILMSEDYKGLVEIIVNRTGHPQSIGFWGDGYTSADKMRLMVGEDGLRCAVTGKVEGVSCDDGFTPPYVGYPACPSMTVNSFSCLTAAIGTVDGTGPFFFGTSSFSGVAAYVPLPIAALAASKTRLYVVRLKTGLNEAPGNYELLGGTTIANTTDLDIGFPVIPSIEARVANALAPNRKSCSLPTVSCLGVDVDARLPLEDELSDNHDGVEDSWRHYLDLARQSANEADALQKEFRDTKLNALAGLAAAEQRKEQQRQLAENAFQAVQDTCGTAIDSARLMELLSGGTGQGQNLDEVLPNVTCPTCDSTSSCVDGKCVRQFGKLLTDPNFSKEPDAMRLANCLDDSPAAVSAFATLGDKKLCVYTQHGSPSNVCPTSLLGGIPCPAVKPLTGCPAAPVNVDLNEADALNYYKNNDPGSTGVNACDLFRRLRATHFDADLTSLQDTNVFAPDRLRDRVGKVSFTAAWGNWVTIAEDGTPRWTTGNTAQGKGSGWPWTLAANCGGAMGGGAPDADGLFCSTLSASYTTQELSAFNTRLYFAALAAALIQGKDGVTLTYPSNTASPCKSTDPSNIIYQGGTNPIRVCTTKVGDADVSNYTYLLTGTPNAWSDPGGGGSFYTGPLNFITKTFQLDPAKMNSNPPPPPEAVLGDDVVFSGLSHYRSLDAPSSGRSDVYQALQQGTALRGDYAALLKVSGSGVIPSELALLSGSAIGAGQLGVGGLLDGLEILCELDANHTAAATQPASFATLGDVEQAGAYLEKLSGDIKKQAARVVFGQIPRLASNALGDVPVTGSFPALSGQMGTAVADLRGALVATRSALPVIAASMQQMGAEMQSLRAQIDVEDAEKGIINLTTLSKSLDRIASCAQSTLNPSGVFNFGAAAAVDCTNGMAQIAIALKQSALEKKSADDKVTIARDAFIERMSQLAENLQNAALGLEQSTENINADLARIDGLRKQARLNLSKAIYAASYQSASQTAYDTAVGSLASLAQNRYLQALHNAKIMSFYAKRAIEQRIGMRLSDMRESLPLVDPPASWEGRICSLSGATSQAFNTDLVALYGDGFIGDYVTQLENVVESYRLKYNFHEGTDTAVVSLRDDVANVRASCSSPARNLLKSSADITPGSLWAARNCNPITVNGVSLTNANCIAVTPAPDITVGAARVPDVAVAGLIGYERGAQGYSLVFGDGGTCAAANGGCGWKTGSAFAQVVHLEPSRYRFSWYTRDTPSTAMPPVVNGANQGIAVFRAAGATTNLATTVNSPDSTPPNTSPFVWQAAGSGATWKRASVEFQVATAGDYEVGFGSYAATRPTIAMTVAAPMLEVIPFNSTATMLSPFQPTSDDGKLELENCEDTNGSIFRAKNWRYECTHLCDQGFTANCTSGPQYCYRDFQFGVSMPWIQNGKLFKYSGFARGNFNYRIESVALNFVGSGVRNCTDSNLPSTCYNAGFVPYSILHEGPFFVRNHLGDDFQASLFDGRIEHARGLALERYITNPISSTDTQLLADYQRSEFLGRPLDGSFTVRVWDEPGVDFNAIQDVQLILKYRYWTASN